jgi:hypothetical protein
MGYSGFQILICCCKTLRKGLQCSESTNFMAGWYMCSVMTGVGVGSREFMQDESSQMMHEEGCGAQVMPAEGYHGLLQSLIDSWT